MIERLSQLAGKHGAFLCQASGYLAVSVVALGVDLAVYWLLLGSFDSAIAPAAIGYSFGLVVHYALASRLVFTSGASGRGLAAEAPTFAKYAATGIAGVVMTTGIVGLCADVLGWSPLAAKVLATLVAFVAVFLARRFVVFGAPVKAALAG